MKASILSEYNKVEWKDVETPKCKPGEVLIKVTYGCICGSDQHIHKGEFHPRTKVPMIMGHEFGGTVAEVGKGVAGWEVGDKVAPDPIMWCGECPACKKGHYPACTSLKLIGIDSDGGFCEYISLPPSMLYKVPAHIPDKHVALVEVLSIGCHAKNRAGVQANDTIVIWGAGKVGLCILEAVRTVTENTVFIVDILDERLAIGPEYYENVIPINAEKENPVEKIKKLTGRKGVDIAFEAVGHAHEIDGGVNPVVGCIQSISGGGKVCVLGLGAEPAPVVFKELIWKEGTIITSRVSHGEFAEVIEHLENGRLKPDALISKVLHGSETQKGFELLDENPAENIKILLDFGSE
ncbi:alcohol dehydrogenase catalytic domain-containing protein [Prolixibacteraceae bacterium Z1-6]|uniref:Alcohol dehydrogenase catalytic domain-containing protein n=1 Tax=Draconibacterium aestuarii TaxID=2998507 RepID=A0A9X3J546_9BACT|nr:alcohol dehydrogenase catalytic domain-containing protein [Prolixibacteraceae bacterium Z1-6]